MCILKSPTIRTLSAVNINSDRKSANSLIKSLLCPGVRFTVYLCLHYIPQDPLWRTSNYSPLNIITCTCSSSVTSSSSIKHSPLPQCMVKPPTGTDHYPLSPESLVHPRFQDVTCTRNVLNLHLNALNTHLVLLSP